MTRGRGVEEVDWAVRTARSDDPNLVLAGRRVHSDYDPVREASTLARRIDEDARTSRADAIVLIGSGLGYVENALREFPGPRLIVFEPFPAIRRRLAELGVLVAGRAQPPQRAVQRVHRAHDLDLLLGTLPREAPMPHIHIHPGYEHAARFEIRFVLRALRRRRAIDAAPPLASAIVTRRDFRVMRRLTFRPTLCDLAGTLRGRTAVIASAGPSLDAALPALSRQKGGVVFTCPQALGRLHRAGVHAHYVVSPDPQDLFSLSRVPAGARFDTLLTDTFASPAMAKDHLARVTYFHLRSPHLHDRVWAAMGLRSIDEPFLTVSETALFLAHFMGARRFVLLGFDFDSDDPRYPHRFRSRNLRGEIVPTNSHYFHAARYLDYFCSERRAEGAELLRSSPGLPIAGCRAFDAGDLLDVLAGDESYETPESAFRMLPERLDTALGVVRRLQTAVRRGRGDARVPSDAHGLGAADLRPLDAAACLAECEAIRRWLEVRIERFEIARRRARAGEWVGDSAGGAPETRA